MEVKLCEKEMMSNKRLSEEIGDNHSVMRLYICGRGQNKFLYYARQRASFDTLSGTTKFLARNNFCL